MTAVKKRQKIHTGLDAAVYRLFGRFHSRGQIVRELLEQAQKIHENGHYWKDLDNRALKEALTEHKGIFRRKGRGHLELLPKALGLVQEAAYRTLGMRPYIVQTAGALALFKGYIAEMATGEGKTLTASLAATLKGWSGYPCHVVTANDYLAERDAEKLAPLYNFCGVSVGSVISTLKPPERKKGYASDITYSTAKEVTADFLRDRLALGSMQHFERRQLKMLIDGTLSAEQNVVMRGLHTAIIDEADSLLIDEAVTPLIIAQNRENESFNAACIAASAVASQLQVGRDFAIDLTHKEIVLKDNLDLDGILEKENLPRQFSGKGFQRELIRQALTAREFFIKDKQYVVQDDKIVIVDEFTGRSMPERSWSDGLHQMVEVKEGVPITPPNETLARLSFQRFFRMYHHLSGMSGTAREAAPELWHVYDLPVVTIPQNRPVQRIMHPVKFFTDQESKWRAIEEDVVTIHAQGRPILVGTRSVHSSEALAARLANRGLDCSVINAVRHKEEASIVSRAGVAGAITVATNMAGRGTDILLDQKSKERGGLHVIATECHESARIDRQLYGRSGRQGDKGSARAFVSLDDELFVRYLDKSVRSAVVSMLNAKAPAADIAAQKAVQLAQQKAQEKAASNRRSVQKADTWLDESLSFTPEDVQ